MAADFSFDIKDYFSDTPEPFVRELTKQLPNGIQMKTSLAASGYDDSMGQSTITYGQALMNVPLFNDPADVVSAQEQVYSGLLGTAMGGVGKTNSSQDQALVTNPPITDQFAPADVAQLGKMGQQPPPPPAPAPDGTTTTPPAPGVPGSPTGAQLASNPNFRVEKTAGGALVMDDLNNGNISPIIVNALMQICAVMTVTVSCGRGDLAGHIGQGHSATSNHYGGRALDVTVLGGENVTPRMGANMRQAIDILDSLSGPKRPTEVLGPVNYKIMKYYTGHETHVHVGTSSWDVPGGSTPPPAVVNRTR